MLPVHALAGQILDAVQSTGCVFIQAPTGSGKSTQVPQILLDSGLFPEGEITVLQPRRLPARMLAARVAEERGSPLGREVGYQIRMDKVGGDSVRIRYATEGVLTRRLLGDPGLPGVPVVVFDEFHERHLESDLALSCLLERRRQGLAVPVLIVMSATLDGDWLEERMRPCVALRSEGRTHPVDIHYEDRPVREEVWERAAAVFEEEAARCTTGDTLVFMPGMYEIQRTISALEQTRAGRGRLLLPLHGELPPERQDLAVRRADKPRVIVSTNVAETSLTIDGVRLVIDSGLARTVRFDPRRGINVLGIDKISRASADQRAGRAGRTAPGRCRRLWTAADHRALDPATAPEIERLDLSEALLAVTGMGWTGDRFPWLQPPPEPSLARAVRLLEDLGALQAGQMTSIGRDMLEFPIHPRYARMLLEAARRGVVDEVCAIAALGQTRDLLIRKVDKDTGERRLDQLGDAHTSDFFRMLRALDHARAHSFRVDACRELGIHAGSARECDALAARFRRLARRVDDPSSPAFSGADHDERAAAVRKCVLAGFADQVAVRLDGGTMRCRIVHGRKGSIGASSAVRDAALVVASSITEIEKSGGDLDVILDQVTAIDAEWLEELFPGSVRRGVETAWDETTRRVTSREQHVYHDLVLGRGHPSDPDPAAAAALLALRVIAGECTLKNWNDEVDQWILRVSLAAEHAPEHLGIKAIDDEARLLLIEQVCHGAFSYKEIKDRPVLSVIQTWLEQWQRVELDRLLPDRLPLPSGRKAKVRYAPGREPVISARIQDFYGLEQTPVFCGGKVAPVVEILAPNYRPVQVTRDLAGFWRETYPQLKQELKRRYPKHEWK